MDSFYKQIESSVKKRKEDTRNNFYKNDREEVKLSFDLTYKNTVHPMFVEDISEQTFGKPPTPQNYPIYPKL